MELRLTLIALCTALCYKFETAAETIVCEMHDYNWDLMTETDVETCNVHNNQIFDGPRVTVDAISKHNDDYYDDTNFENVQGVAIKSAPNASKFPAYLNYVLPNLILIEIINSKLAEITRDDLSSFEKLKYLDLGWNLIKFLDADTFEANTELEVIHLQANQIERIDAHTFAPLKKLRALNLETNVCSALANFETRNSVEQALAVIDDGGCAKPTTRAYLDDALDTSLRECDERNSRLAASNTKKDEELERQQKESEDLERVVASLSNSIDSIRENLVNKQNELFELNQKLDDSEAEAAELSEQIQAMVDEDEGADELESLMKEFMDRKQEKEQKEQELASQLAALVENKDRCEEEMVKMVTQLSEAAAMSEELSKCEGQLKSANNELIAQMKAAEKCKDNNL